MRPRLPIVPAAALVSLLGAFAVVPALAFAEPALPRAFVDTGAVASAGRTIAIGAGGDLQDALAAARPGDTITLAAGAVFRGPFTLPRKQGAGWITVRTSAPDHELPPGTRVSPAQAGRMPRLVSASGPVIITAPGAHHYRLIGLEISPAPGVHLRNVIVLASPDGSQAGLPHHIIFERSYIHGDREKGARRGIALNSAATAVIDSHLSDFKIVGADSQAICGWGGPGPYRIVNNFLEAAGENVMFGGADPSIPGLIPSDIEIRRNHFAKPLSWKIGHPEYAGVPWTVKNLFELKNARRVLVEGNLFERNWVHAQAGFAVVLKSANEEGRAPWSVTQDVHIVNNTFRQSASGIKISGIDHSAAGRTARVAIRNNLFLEIGGPAWGGGGRLFQLLQGTQDVVIEHNTAFQTDAIVVAEGQPNTGFVFRFNIAPHNAYGVKGAGAGVGADTLARYFPGALFEGNVLVGAPHGDRLYPPGNYFPASLDAVGFGNPAAGDYSLAADSPYRGGARGRDIGADQKALELQRGSAVSRVR